MNDKMLSRSEELTTSQLLLERVDPSQQHTVDGVQFFLKNMVMNMLLIAGIIDILGEERRANTWYGHSCS